MFLPSARASLVLGLRNPSSETIWRNETVSRCSLGTSIPDRALAGDRRDDPHPLGLERHRQVVGEVGDLADAGPGRRDELVHRDDRPGVDLGHPAEDLVVGQRLGQPLGLAVDRLAIDRGLLAVVGGQERHRRRPVAVVVEDEARPVGRLDLALGRLLVDGGAALGAILRLDDRQLALVIGAGATVTPRRRRLRVVGVIGGGGGCGVGLALALVVLCFGAGGLRSCLRRGLCLDRRGCLSLDGRRGVALDHRRLGGRLLALDLEVTWKRCVDPHHRRHRCGAAEVGGQLGGLAAIAQLRHQIAPQLAQPDRQPRQGGARGGQADAHRSAELERAVRPAEVGAEHDAQGQAGEADDPRARRRQQRAEHLAPELARHSAEGSPRQACGPEGEVQKDRARDDRGCQPDSLAPARAYLGRSVAERSAEDSPRDQQQADHQQVARQAEEPVERAADQLAEGPHQAALAELDREQARPDQKRARERGDPERLVGAPSAGLRSGVVGPGARGAGPVALLLLRSLFPCQGENVSRVGRRGRTRPTLPTSNY